MPAKKQPTPRDAITVGQILLDGLARNADIPEPLNQLAALHPRNDTFPGEVFLRLGTDALDWPYSCAVQNWASVSHVGHA